jgi:hypothetical protein
LLYRVGHSFLYLRGRDESDVLVLIGFRELILGGLLHLEVVDVEGLGRYLLGFFGSIGLGLDVVLDVFQPVEDALNHLVAVGIPVDSPDAHDVPRESFQHTCLHDFAVADGLDDFDEPECIDVIVSNPPYIESAVCDALDPRVRDYEPRLALDGGATGLDFYDRYLGDALNVLKPGGAVFFEIGEGQGGALAKLMADYGFADVKIEKDFAGHDRYASGVLA